ncbi:MAG: electron transport complex subunit RsxC [Clostridia bacterium]|nr:electron transport complex subunit RsxC [Clostridia bacterium]
MLSFLKIGKTHVPHKKKTADMPAVRMALPETVLIPMSQHIGAPANLIVKPGDKVYVGTLIGEAGGFVSANIHSSVSGVVKKIESYLMSNGRSCPAVFIESDGEMTPDPAIAPPSVTNFKELSDAARAAGLVGLGGAGFPTSVKLDSGKIDSIDTLLINAAECEPYITSDTRTMLDDAEWVYKGINLVMSLSGIKSCIIGIESNKSSCIEKMRETFLGDEKVRVEVLPSTYPQGGEKILIYNTTGRAVPEGKLPSDVGVLVMNVTTVAFLAKYVETGMPLVEKCVTVDGSAIKDPKNIIVPVGTSISDVFKAAGGVCDDCAKVLMGGPMMGIAVYSYDTPVLKNNNAILAFSKKEAKLPKTTACIHCGRCVAACPMGLNPTIYAKSMNVEDKAERAERLTAAKINLCIECGSCSFVCPAKRPLVENNRLSKAFLREASAAKPKQ